MRESENISNGFARSTKLGADSNDLDHGTRPWTVETRILYDIKILYKILSFIDEALWAYHKLIESTNNNSIQLGRFT